jgi:hypothetical protein
VRGSITACISKSFLQHPVPAKLLETKGSRREDWNTLTDKLLDGKARRLGAHSADGVTRKVLKTRQCNISNAMRVRKLAVITRKLGIHLWIT